MKKGLLKKIAVYGTSTLALGALSFVASPDTEVEAAEVNYTVDANDTLFSIAEEFLGDGWQYNQIAEANGISNPNLIHTGQTLTFDDGQGEATQEETDETAVLGAQTDEVTAPQEQNTPNSSEASTAVPEYVLKVVESEAGPGYQDKANVFSVIVNRANSGRWGGTDYMSVVTAPGQFQVTWNGMADAATVSDSTRQAVADVLNNGVTTGAESFRASGDGVTNVFF